MNLEEIKAILKKKEKHDKKKKKKKNISQIITKQVFQKCNFTQNKMDNEHYIF